MCAGPEGRLGLGKLGLASRLTVRFHETECPVTYLHHRHNQQQRYDIVQFVGRGGSCHPFPLFQSRYERSVFWNSFLMPCSELKF